MNLMCILFSLAIPYVTFGQGNFSVNFPGNFTEQDFRKHYGLSLNDGCADYVKVFKCLSACKSMGYQIFRMNTRCKCTCHDMKTSTILPFFKWRTNGTTRAVPKTQSPKLYDVVGTLSPRPDPYVEPEETTTVTTDPASLDGSTDTAAGNSTGTDSTSDGTTETGATEGGEAGSSTDTTEKTIDDAAATNADSNAVPTVANNEAITATEAAAPETSTV